MKFRHWLLSRYSVLMLVMSLCSARSLVAEERITFYGRSSSLILMKEMEQELGIEVIPLSREDIENQNYDAVQGKTLVLLWGARNRGGGGGGRTTRGRGEAARGSSGGRGGSGRRGTTTQGRGGAGEAFGEQFEAFLKAVKKRDPQLQIVTNSRTYEGMQGENSDLIKTGTVKRDEKIDGYLSGRNASRENLKRLVQYLAIAYLNKPGEVIPPEMREIIGLTHPETRRYMTDVAEFLEWSQQRDIDVKQAPRIVILSNQVFYVSRNRAGMKAMVEALEKKGALVALAMMDEQETQGIVSEFGPDVVIDATHRRGDLDWYRSLGVPHLQAVWLSSRQTVEEWEHSDSRIRNMMGLASAEAVGVIEPHIVSGREDRQDDLENFIAIPDRIERISDRALAWAKLSRLSNARKKIVMLHAGAGGSDLNHLASLRGLLSAMQEAGYTIPQIPADDQELLEKMELLGSQIHIKEQEKLDRLARSGQAVLIPLATYLNWFHDRIPPEQQKAVIETWGTAPGNVMVWENENQERFLVVPKIELGNVWLVPKPAPQSETNDFSQVERRKNSKSNPPSHNILATYFWMEETFQADAVVVWGALSIDLLLPKKSVGLSQHDWPDILWGAMPNIRPFALGSLTFAIPAKRRTKSVLVNHLPPATIPAQLDDELQNLANDILKWRALSEGPLKERFRKSIVSQIQSLRLDQDLKLTEDHSYDETTILEVQQYLNEIHAQQIPVNSHVLGQAVREDLLIPYLNTCLGSAFVKSLSEVIDIPSAQNDSSGARQNYLKQRSEELLKLVIKDRLTLAEALNVMTHKSVDTKRIPREVVDGIELARRLALSFQDPSAEITNIVAAMNGKFIEPGPGHLPPRNPAAVPTGRNLYPLNTEEIPSKPSWELGKQLIDQLLAEKKQENGRYPNKIAFSLSTRGTMSDYGVLESQILYTLGVRPVWSQGNRVADVELIPAAELGRPRIDVFIEPKHYYSDYLSGRLELIDKAIRLVSALEEKENRVRENTSRIEAELLAKGMSKERAQVYSRGRIFAVAPDRFGSGLYDGLLESTGLWDTSEQLVDIYVGQHDYLFTQGAWGEKSPEIYKKQLQGTEVVLRSLNRRGALSGRSYIAGGTLCLVTKVLTGTAPQFYLSDLRQPGEERIMTAKAALNRDYRAILFNRHWIDAMMKEGGRGGGAIASKVWHTLAFKINLEDSVDDGVWDEIVNVYVRDSKNLNIKDWFENNNHEAYQEMLVSLLEAVRKGYWNADSQTKQELVKEYSRSVIRHGLASPDRNLKLEAFVNEALSQPAPAEFAALQTSFEDALNTPAESPVPAEENQELADRDASEEQKREVQTEQVEGQRMVESNPGSPATPAYWTWIVSACVLLFLGVGMMIKFGATK